MRETVRQPDRTPKHRGSQREQEDSRASLSRKQRKPSPFRAELESRRSLGRRAELLFDPEYWLG